MIAKIQRVGVLLAAACFICLSAFADPPIALHHYWRNTSFPSHYVLYDQASRTWNETIGCKKAYHFTQVKNALNTLLLLDASRNMKVKLNYESMSLQAAGASTFIFYQPGTFDTRTLFSHNDAQGRTTGSIVKKDACIWEEWFPGATRAAFRFKQTLVDKGAVEIFDRSRNITVRLEPSRMLLRQGNSAWQLYKTGRWN